MSTTFTHTHADRSFSGLSNLDTVETAANAPLVIALHGGTYSSQYFDIPGHSLLERATTAGVPVIALDRPNYGESTPLESDGSIILDNAEVLSTVIESIWQQHGAGTAGVVLIAHSIGGAIATAIAANPKTWPLLGLATSGCLVRVPAESRKAWEDLPPIPMIDLPVPLKDQVMFGPAGSYAPEMPAASHPANAPVPRAELLDITGEWIENRAGVCARVAVPVHHRHAEFDALWITDQNEVDDYRAGFTASPAVDAELYPGVGHCIDFHSVSEAFQNEQLAFARKCAATA